ncbi:MAG: hypothetical protein JO233_04980, partial [Candidatus Eremiobacteraeota bacterium]|nr:hypothetical protein [Candidatus Eremiobacteraeota bacterium]
ILSTLALGFVAAQLKAPGVRQLIREAHARTLEARRSQRYQDLGFFRRLLAAVKNDAGPADQALLPWYPRAIILTAVNAVAHAAVGVLPLVALAAVMKERDHPCAPLLAGATLGSALGILGDPVPAATPQTILFPLYPVIGAGCALAADFLIDLLLSTNSDR